MYAVRTCEIATGIVCHPDGRRYLTTHGPRVDPEFPTEAEAAAYSRGVAAVRPDLECWVIDPEGRTLYRIVPTSP
jgi:hypothetical protein